jgi:8-oxo-dGTP pyrophosphatase MutT (NUDIX family)
MVKTASVISTRACHQVAALPWRREVDGSLSVMLITSRTNGKWMLPKGWPMDGRSDAQAARREALEEAGIDGVVADDPVGVYHFTKLFNDGTSKPGEACIYALAVTRERKEWKEKGQRQRQWMPVAQAAQLAFEPDLSRFLNELALGLIEIPEDTDVRRSSVA